MFRSEFSGAILDFCYKCSEEIRVKIKSKVKDVFKFVCNHLGIKELRFCGLTVFVEKEHRFLDLDQKIVKIAPKSWKSSAGWGIDGAGNPSVILYLRVLTYVDYVSVINCPVTLHHYYLQLRENTRKCWSDVNCVPEERCWEVAALALQADFGNYTPSKHKTEYFSPESYFPLWVINNRGMHYITINMPQIHQDLRGLGREEAMVKFCREVSKPPAPVNLHFYGVRKLKSDRLDNILMGITPRGIEMLEVLVDGHTEPVFFFYWRKIAKLCFERRKFTLVSMDGNKKVIFFTSSDEKSRYLLEFCRKSHQQTMSLQPEIFEARKQEMKERKHFRESYVCTDEFEKEWFREHGHYPESFYSSPNRCESAQRTVDRSFLLNASEGNQSTQVGCQRVSMASDASSNTTSGIVSDKQHTHDDSEEVDIDLELSLPNTVDSSPMVSELSLSSPGVDSMSPYFGATGSGGDSAGVWQGEDELMDHQNLKSYSTSTFLYLDSCGCRPAIDPPPPPSDKGSTLNYVTEFDMFKTEGKLFVSV